MNNYTDNSSMYLTNTPGLFREFLNTSPDLIRNLKSGEIRLNINSVPEFADHAFQDMVVLPGSAFLEMALTVYSVIYNRRPSIIKNIRFGNLILLSDEERLLRFEVSDISGSRKKIIFYELNEQGTVDEKFTTSVEIDSEDDYLNQTADVLSEEFKVKGRTVLSEEFYNKLYENGNQYGTSFRNIKQIWIDGNEALGELNFSNTGQSGKYILNPVKLDSFTQLLSSVSKETGRTFILSSINEIRIHNTELHNHMWCKAKLHKPENGSNNEFKGELKAYGADGTLHLELEGVRFKYLDKTNRNKPAEKDICIASTFTAEPLEDSLKFWKDFFDASYDFRFAPYNQVFQELLDPNSTLSSNKKGFNVILLALEDWVRSGHKLIPLVSREEMDKLFENKSRFTLPNRVEIVQLNKYETEYVYKEIFVDKCYLRHGITINDGDTVIDIGANIGLFTLFVNQHCKDPEVYSFEPSPMVYDLLKANSRVYGKKVKTFNCGVSDKEGTADFTFYENSSVFSSFNANETEDKEAIQAVVKNILRNSSDQQDTLDEYTSEITEKRLESRTIECRLLSVSDIIRENNISKIDLLKIDAEKSELNIIRGIKEEDWNKIKQVVIEIHDKTGNILAEIESVLKAKGFSCAVEEEEMLKGSGLFNVFAIKSAEETRLNNEGWKEKKLHENIHNFADALESFIQRSPVPAIISVTPVSPENFSDKAESSLFVKYENELFSRLSKLPNVYTISSDSLLSSYGQKDYFDLMGEELGHIPYTLPFYTSLGTSLFRLMLAIQNPPRKVIAVDCDNTLWKGVCGEDGPLGIRITESHKQFQKFLIDQIESGMLVCLCSKNNEEDVMEVFRQRDDMVLKKEHLVSWRTNWNSKSSNLLSLSEELNLGLDSFIFIDDNPVECAEIKAQYPEIVTLQIPQDENNISRFIKNAWIFDHLKITEEDKKRTVMYKENLQREKYRSGALTLRDFLEGLQLNIKISSPGEEQIERVSQLTYRTNQFNFTARRRPAAEIREFLSNPGNDCMIAEVADRFGDYGLVGLLLYTTGMDALKVDTFLLSCRVLGRGVEYKILSEAGKKAVDEGLEFVEVEYIKSGKNRPALDFILKIGSLFRSNDADDFTIRFPAQYLAELRYESFIEDSSAAGVEEKEENKPVSSGGKTVQDLSDKLQLIADNLHNPFSVYNKIEDLKLQQVKQRENMLLPRTDFEKQVALIWQNVLSKTNLSMDDKFFDVGGTSLKAVQLVASLKKELDLKVSIVDIFECPTIELLSKKFGSKKDKENISVTRESGAERGSRRRNLSNNRRRNK